MSDIEALFEAIAQGNCEEAGAILRALDELRAPQLEMLGDLMSGNPSVSKGLFPFRFELKGRGGRPSDALKKGNKDTQIARTVSHEKEKTKLIKQAIGEAGVKTKQSRSTIYRALGPRKKT
jgi:hypothetical protein